MEGIATRQTGGVNAPGYNDLARRRWRG